MQGACKYNYEGVVGHSDPRFNVESRKGFTVVSSDFYPELSSWYEDVDEEMCEEYRKKDLAIREKKARQNEDAGS